MVVRVERGTQPTMVSPTIIDPLWAVRREPNWPKIGDLVPELCRTSSGADLPVETVRRMACDAAIIPMVFDGSSVPIDVGRSKRLATVNQRRALEARYRTCASPGCDVGFERCHIHHIDHWENGGSTDLHNLIPLCSRHHQAAHEACSNVIMRVA